MGELEDPWRPSVEEGGGVLKREAFRKGSESSKGSKAERGRTKTRRRVEELKIAEARNTDDDNNDTLTIPSLEKPSLT